MTHHSNSNTDVYVMSKLPNIAEELKSALPNNIRVIKVELSDKRLKFDKSVKVQDDDLNAVQGAEILVADSMLLAQMLYKLPNLKWAQSTWTGVEMIFEELDNLKPKPNFRLTRYVDPYFGELMSNYVVAQIINIERGLYSFQEKQKISEWARPFFPNFRVLSDLTVGLLGAGVIGSTIGKHLSHEGAKVLAYVKSNEEKPRNGFFDITTDLTLLLKKCDYICNVLPSTPETRGMLDGDVLKQCQKKPVFINIGRGDIIKDKSLINALNEGWISKAVLDVFEEEPLPPDNVLWKMPQVIITPHIGAIPRISGSAKFIAENYRRYVAGKDLLNEIDWNKGY